MMQIDTGEVIDEITRNLEAAEQGIQKVYHDPPVAVDASSELPRAFIQLTNIVPATSSGGNTAGISEVCIRQTYRVTVQKSWPSSGTLNDAKVALTNAILAQLTGQKFYVGKWRRRVSAINFADYSISPQERYFEASIDFEVDVISTQ